MDPLELVWRAFRLQRDAYVALDEGSAGLRMALGVVFLGGISASFGQSLVLFANRVRPRRFVWSLLLSAVLFVFTYLTWATSTWLVASFGFEHKRPYLAALRTVGLAYVPQLLAFLAITPYFGTFVSALLSIWTLLGIVVATSVAFDLSTAQAAASAALGWVLWQLLQRTVGRPIRRATAGLRGAVAGHRLMTVGEAIEFEATGHDGVARRDTRNEPAKLGDEHDTEAQRDTPNDAAAPRDDEHELEAHDTERREPGT